MSNIIERLVKLNQSLEKVSNNLNSVCADFSDISESLKSSKDDLNHTKSRLSELKQGGFCQKESWSLLEQTIAESIEKLEQSCVMFTQVINSEKVTKEFQWQQEQKSKIDIFVQEKKEKITENYRKQLKSIK